MGRKLETVVWVGLGLVVLVLISSQTMPNDENLGSDIGNTDTLRSNTYLS